MVHNFFNYVKLFVLTSLLSLALVLSVNAWSVKPDRISFYNVPSQSEKFEFHIDYANGEDEEESAGVCVPNEIVSKTLNLYTFFSRIEGCGEEIHQHLNLRPVQECRWDFEHDPYARVQTYGLYGTSVITGHYDQGEFNLPIPTGTLSLTVVMSHTEGTELWTGNAEYWFNESIGCVEPPPTPTSTSTEIPTETSTPTEIPTLSPTSTPTLQSTVEELPAHTPTPTLIVVCCAYTPEPTVTPTLTPTFTPPVVITLSPTPQSPTGLDPSGEPARILYLPLVDY